MSDVVPRVEKRDRKVSVRLTTAGYTHIEDRAARADVDVAHMIRRMLAYAAQNMPDTWTPKRGRS